MIDSGNCIDPSGTQERSYYEDRRGAIDETAEVELF
jgi:hypothetical protein